MGTLISEHHRFGATKVYLGREAMKIMSFCSCFVICLLGVMDDTPLATCLSLGVLMETDVPREHNDT